MEYGGNVSRTFSNLGTNIGNAISGAVKSGINGVISLIQNTINGAIRLINGGIKLINLIPGVSVGQVGYLSLPRLAKGGVLTEETAVIGGEYSGAKSNPEIVTPQNIMEETFEKVLSKNNTSGNSGAINFVNELKVNGKTFARQIIEDLNNEAQRLGYKPILQRG